MLLAGRRCEQRARRGPALHAVGQEVMPKPLSNRLDPRKRYGNLCEAPSVLAPIFAEALRRRPKERKIEVGGADGARLERRDERAERARRPLDTAEQGDESIEIAMRQRGLRRLRRRGHRLGESDVGAVRQGESRGDETLDDVQHDAFNQCVRGRGDGWWRRRHGRQGGIAQEEIETARFLHPLSRHIRGRIGLLTRSCRLATVGANQSWSLRRVRIVAVWGRIETAAKRLAKITVSTAIHGFLIQGVILRRCSSRRPVTARQRP